MRAVTDVGLRPALPRDEHRRAHERDDRRLPGARGRHGDAGRRARPRRARALRLGVQRVHAREPASGPWPPGRTTDRAGPGAAPTSRRSRRSPPAACSPRSRTAGRCCSRAARSRGWAPARSIVVDLRVGEPRVPAGDVRAHARADVVGVGAAVAGRARGRRARRRPRDVALGVRLPAAVPAGRDRAHAARACGRWPAPPARRPRRAGSRAALALAAGIGLFLAALELDGDGRCSSCSPRPAWRSRSRRCGAAAGRHAARRARPAVRDRRCAGCSPSRFLGCDAFMPLALTELRGFSSSQAGLVISAASLSWSLGSFLQARLRPRRRRRGPAATARCVGLAVLLAGIAIDRRRRARRGGRRSPSRSRGWMVAGLRHRDRLPVGRRARPLARRAAARRACVSAALQLVGDDRRRALHRRRRRADRARASTAAGTR